MANGKLKMSNKRFMAIMIPIMAVVAAIIIAATVIMNLFAATMDMYLGRGKRVVETPKGTESWDTEYYETKYSSDTDSRNAAAAIAEEVADSGEVLMKNNGVLPLAKNSKVTPFGYRYLSPIYGGTGSGGGEIDESFWSSPAKSLKEKFEVNADISSAMERAFDGGDGGNGFAGASTAMPEFDSAIYSAAASTCVGTTAIVFLGRIGGEGNDLQSTAYPDGTPHYLALSANEKKTIAFAKQNCAKVIVILNTSNVMEISELMSGEYEADAILWVGGTGCRGFRSMAKILCGEVNPSGRLVDTWVKDLKSDPTMANFGTWNYTNLKWCARNYGKEGQEDNPEYAAKDESVDPSVWAQNLALYKQAPFVEYEEGIYLGYRYYETAYDVLDNYDYYAAVNYPFGYGLSYTTFEQKITGFKDAGDAVQVTVEIANKGDKDGKDAVQIYYNPPYTKLDEDSLIEKATKNLVAFDKVEVPANSTRSVTLTFNKEDMASYCYTRNNGDGTKGCYMLEQGDYEIILGKNSHEEWDIRKTTVSATEWYDSSNPRKSEKDGQALLDDEGNPLDMPAKKEADRDAQYVAASNRFDSCTSYIETSGMRLLTRKNFAGTLPQSPTNLVASEAVIKEYAEFDYKTDEKLGNVENSLVYTETAPAEKQSNGLVVSDLRGKSYYDETWDKLLDQIDYTEAGINDFLSEAAYNTGRINSIGLNETINRDGPQTLVIWSGLGLTQKKWCSWPSEPIIAATFDVELAERVGEGFGDEALTTGVNGWYGPGLNIHRSAFSGRNFEYYSEDALLSGKMGAAEITGAGNKGLFAFPKHFALNDQEKDREGMITWASEQTIREVYLRAFEIAVKEARMTVKYISDTNGAVSSKVVRGCTAIMASKNCIGATLCRSNYELLNNVLRDEWGFMGCVVSDMETLCASPRHDKALRAGLDLWMSVKGTGQFVPIYPDDISSPTAKACIRTAIKNVAYTVANSNALNNTAPGAIVYYKTSPWVICLIIANVVIWLAIAAGIGWIVYRLFDEKKNPEKYKANERI